MTVTIADTYYLKALGSYPYDLEEAMENLNYALNYDDEHVEANILMARFYTYQVVRFDLANEYINRALAVEPRNVYAFEVLVKVLMYRKMMGELRKAASYASKLEGANEAYFDMIYALGFEQEGELKKAKRILKGAILKTINDGTICQIEEHLSRIKKKRKLKTK